MCIVFEPAELTGTKLYIGKGVRDAKEVHVLGYQNTVKTLSGPNCMLLHFPTASPMTPDNVVDTSECPDLMDELVKAAKPKSRGIAKSFAVCAGSSPDTHVFDHDIYTIILTNKAADLKKALEQVPEARRPKIQLSLILFYARNFKDHSFALCCFDNQLTKEANPLLWWYEPSNPDTLMAPGLDSHTGYAPDLKSPVDVDHWVITGTSKTEEIGNDYMKMNKVHYTDPVSGELEGLLPEYVIGRQYNGKLKNGDFVVKPDILSETKNVTFDRVSPTT